MLAFVSVSTIIEDQDENLVLMIGLYTKKIELGLSVRDQFQKEWDKIEKRHLLRGLLYNIGIPDQDIPDLINETGLQAYRHIDNLKNWNDFDRWLCGIAKNVCRRYWRGDRKRNEKQDKATEQFKDQQMFHPPPDEDDRIINKLLLEECMYGLSCIEREIILLRVVEGRTWKEIAKKVGMPRSTVAWRYGGIVKKLQSRFYD